MNGKFLLIIPEFNDSKRLAPFLTQLSIKMDGDTDIQIVSDGSTKKEHLQIIDLIESLKGKGPRPNILSPIIYRPNKGKGSAIRTGFKCRKSFHNMVGFVDADGAISPEEINRLKKILQSKPTTDAIFASRRLKTSIVERDPLRRMGSFIIAKLIRLITSLELHDTQCGLKIIKSDIYERIENELQSEGFEFDIELALLLKQKNANILEAPIRWKEIDGSKVHILKDTIKLLINSLSIRRRIKTKT